MSAHRVNRGQMPDLSNGRNTDFFFLERENPEEAARTIVDLVRTRLPRSYRVPPGDIQVLTPMQKGVVGASNMNQALQEAVNPHADGLNRGGYLFRAGDKVMQIRNNYDKEVFNGDIGVIESVDLEERTLTVNFDSRSVLYDATELDELTLAYATTIHKAQGSEYPIVVIPVLMTHYVMLQRNLIYTGITRAKRALILVGTKKALALAVHNVTVTQRNTMLKERLQKENERRTMDRPGQPQREQEQTAPERVEGVRNLSHEAWLKTDLFARLAQSRFRSRFHLDSADLQYVREKGLDTLRSHALDLIGKRLAPAEIPNDGKQTPMKGHPVFIAQHATGTCCRTCLQKWHGIPSGRELTAEEQSYVADVLMKWIGRETQYAGDGGLK